MQRGTYIKASARMRAYQEYIFRKLAKPIKIILETYLSNNRNHIVLALALQILEISIDEKPFCILAFSSQAFLLTVESLGKFGRSKMATFWRLKSVCEKSLVNRILPATKQILTTASSVQSVKECSVLSRGKQGESP